MADLRISSGLPAVSAPTPARTSEAVRAAQRAFFDTALGAANAPVAARPAAASIAATPVAAIPARQVVPGPVDGQDPPTRPMRPGSLLDIRV